MKILIADDEFLARASLRSIIAEFNLPIEWIIEAIDGEDMTTQLANHLPDVAFVDIRMPKLNGLQAINAGKAISPQTKWYILTGFPEFDYAQEAIRLGVSGYLLKPVQPDELFKVLQDSIKESKNWKITQNKQFERILMALNNGLTSIEFEEIDSFLLRANYLGAIIFIDSQLHETAKADKQIRIAQVFRKLSEEFLDNQARIAILVLSSGNLAIIGAWESPSNDQGRMSVIHYFEAIEKQISDQSDDNTSITVLVSNECATYNELQTSLEQLQKVAPLRVLCGINLQLEISDLNKRARQPGWLEVSRLVLDLCQAFRERHYLQYMRAVDSLKTLLPKLKIPGNHFPMNSLADYLNCSLNCHLEANQGLEKWDSILRTFGDRLIGEHVKDEASGMNIVEQVTAFINRNYMHDIGIGQIAEKFNITPNYLSTLFHKKNGKTFMGYLKSVRMLRARELLTNADLQIQQVAEQVGYLNPRHFARLFDDYFGYLPSEYRNNLKDH